MAGQQAGDSAFRSALSRNQAWATNKSSSDPSFFQTLAKGQAPPLLWIGCSDSRVPETTILDSQPGDVFVHRNIANVVSPTDLSMLTAVEFSVRHLKVKHIVLCGHTSCGGCNAALGNARLPVLDLWLLPMRAVREKYADELAALEGAERTTALAKRNVQAGVNVLRRLPTVIEAMKERGLQVHGTIFDLATGLLEEVETEEQDAEGKKRVDAFETS